MENKENLQKEKSSEEEDAIIKIKIALIGKTRVGKTALCYRFLGNTFPEEHDKTIEDEYKKNIVIDGFNCEVQLLDTAGQEDYQTMLNGWINNSNCFILVCSVDDSESFDNIKKKYNKIVKNKEKEIYSCIVVPNKIDIPETDWKISEKDIEEFAGKNKLPIIKSSAKTPENVKEIFTKVVHDYLIKLNKIRVNKTANSCIECPCF